MDPLLTHRIHANRLRRLAHEGEQYTPQFLERFDPLRRYATMVAYLLDMTATLTDTALEMHDHIMGLLFKQGQKKHLAQFEQRGRAINAKYGPEPGLVFYTHISDQLDPYRTKVITGTPHEAPHMIDGLLYHETDLNIHEHYVDTGGYTDQVFRLLTGIT